MTMNQPRSLGPLSMTTKTETDRCSEIISKCMMDSVAKLESEFEQQIFLECIATMSDELLRHANVVSDDKFLSELAENDNRFKPETKAIASDDLCDLAAMQQADTYRQKVRAMANDVHCAKTEALALSTEILNLEIESLLKSKVFTSPNEIKEVPNEVREAVENMEAALKETKEIFGKYDALPSNVKGLEDLLHQIHLGMNMGQSQTQDTIDTITEGLLKTDAESKEGKSPRKIWVDLLSK